MTKFQITVLIILALIACGIFTITGIVAYAMLNQPQQTNIDTNQGIAIAPEQTEEPPTSTITPTFTPQPTATPIPGWKRFEGGGVVMWLPASFEGGDSVENLDLILTIFRDLGAGYEQLAQTLEQDPAAMPFFAFDNENRGTTVNVTLRELPVELDLQEYMDAYTQALAEQPFFTVKVTEQAIIELDQRQVGQLMLEVGEAESLNFQLAYIIKNDNTVWTVNYAAPPEQIGQQLPIFQQSIQTFQITGN